MRLLIRKLIFKSRTKKINCYFYLLIWICIISAVLYWLLTIPPTAEILNINPNNEKSISDFLQNLSETKYQLEKKTAIKQQLLGLADVDDSRFAVYDGIQAKHPDDFVIDDSVPKSIIDPYVDIKKQDLLSSSPNRLCNWPEKIKIEDENWDHPEYKLNSIVILFRHGDRGPLTHVGSHNISHISCHYQPSSSSLLSTALATDLQSLIKFSETMSKIPGYSTFIGPFHSFPKMPVTSSCHLGQLTQLGSAQLIQLGKLLRGIYQQTLFPSNNQFKIISYSTRYRRTLQSLISFLYGFLGSKYIVPNVNLRESQSITFCFKDCSCKLVERLKKLATKSVQTTPADKLEMTSVVNKLNNILGVTKNKRTGVALLDLLLIYSCHNISLPCKHKSNQQKQYSFQSQKDESQDCITTNDVTNLINLIKKETIANTNDHYSLLSAYGLLKEILRLALQMSSSPTSSDENENNNFSNQQTKHSSKNFNKIAIFSGHDTTIQSVLGALGIYKGHSDIKLPPYASRFIFEFYTKVKNVNSISDKYFFRAIYNGIAVTHLISFCKVNFQDQLNIVEGEQDDDSNNNIVNEINYSHTTTTKQYFCPLESLVRFLHDHYFDSFGNTTTNFREACQT